MSSIELRLAPIAHRNKQELTDLEAKLKELKLQSPDGERKKKLDHQNPEYLAQRSPILDRKRLLAARQSEIRRVLRKENLYERKSY